MVPFVHNAKGITVVANGKPYLVPNDSPRFELLLTAIRANDDAKIIELANSDSQLKDRLGTFGEVEVFRGHVTFKGQDIHGTITERIISAANAGLPFEPIARFLDNVKRNPSFRAVQDLYGWIEHNQMPLTEDGCFLAYKIIGPDWKDLYTRTMDNSIGATVTVPRNMVDENPDQTCSYGLHACGYEYLPNYGGFYGAGNGGNRVVMVKVNPADVVAFPKDYGNAKFRCCGYVVQEEVPHERAKEFHRGNQDSYAPAEPPRWKVHTGQGQPTETVGKMVDVIDNDGTQIDYLNADTDIEWVNNLVEDRGDMIDRFRVVGDVPESEDERDWRDLD